MMAVIGVLVGPATLCASNIAGQTQIAPHDDGDGCNPSSLGDAPCILLCGAIPSTAEMVFAALSHGAPAPKAIPGPVGVDVSPPTPPPKQAPSGRNEFSHNQGELT